MPPVPTWSPATELSATEARVLRRCKKQPIFGFLRAIRHELFDDSFQRELTAMYDGGRRGRVPVAPALLAMATLLQAARRVSDQDAALAAANDRAWQVVLGTLDAPDDPRDDEDGAPFGQTALFDFRLRLIAHDMDRRLVERTIELATRSGLFSPRALRAAFDASPLRGAGRVEDTINLIGHAARELVSTIAARLDKPFDVMAREAGIPLLEGTSMKAALDIDWTDLGQSHQALQRLLGQAQSLSDFIATHRQAEPETPPLPEQLETLRQVIAQDLEPDPSGKGSRIKRGVAKERRISIRDPQMRHGRKSKAVRFDGYKRHAATLRGERIKLIGAVALTAANRPEGEASYDLFADVERQGLAVATLDVDRAYLMAAPVQWRHGLGLRVNCRAPSVGHGDLYDKTHFPVDLERGRMRCPGGQERPAQAGSVVRFDGRTCNACPQKAQCTKSNQGRSISLHPQEAQLIELRRRQKTPEGRAELRRRVVVEHALARLGQIQGNKARYCGSRKNLFDLRRAAVVANLFALREAGFANAA
jgi:Transposase DDE domain